MSTIHVTLVVDTDALPSDPSQSPAAACLLYDSCLDADTGSSTDFTVHANPGDTVIFHISSKNNTSAVAISSFAYLGGAATVFKSLPSSPNWAGIVGNSPGKSESYTIGFKANGNTYTLDPDIKVNS